MTRLIENTKQFIKSRTLGEGSGHDWWHIKRVYEMSQQLIQQLEKRVAINKEVVELAALLHDIADWKFNDGDDNAGPQEARLWLERQHANSELVQHVCTIIKNISFKGSEHVAPELSIEGQIVQDADRLDAIGAIGIARAFAYGGYKKRILFDPSIHPEQHQDEKAYKANQSTTINHFFEKLLIVKDRLNTEPAKQIAINRQRFMIEFLDEFFKENNDSSSWHATAIKYSVQGLERHESCRPTRLHDEK
ncbi:MAG: HD domain-containing protein [Sporolactobacillus sp.]